MLPRAFRRYQCVCAALLLLQSQAAAVTLDWDTVSWVDGSLSNSFDVDGGGNDITVSVTPNGGAPLVPYSVAPNPQTPTVNAVFQGGLFLVENTLTLAVDLSDADKQTITIYVAFSPGGASNVAFTLFDIDAGGGTQDHLTSIHALSVDGFTLIAPTITPSADNTLIGSGVNQSVVGTGNTNSTGLASGRGNVGISFGSNVIQSFTFNYGGTNAFPNPAYQHFGMHDINFTPVPEVNPAIMSVFSCLAAIALIWRHRTSVRNKP